MCCTSGTAVCIQRQMEGDNITADGVRRRKTAANSSTGTADDAEREEGDSMEAKPTVTNGPRLDTGTYWLTRIVLLRFIAFIYFIAFLVAFHQNRALIGKNGLLPSDQYLQNIKRHVKGSGSDMFQYAPTILWLFDYENNIDFLLDTLAVIGMVMSLVVMIVGGANMIWMLLMWVVYHSVVNVGQRWYGFGWESQLLESGFLASFLCPLLTFRAIPRHTPTSMVVIWGFRWLIFRIMLGAGLIKIRGDKCWRDLTCMNYHYEQNFHRSDMNDS